MKRTGCLVAVLAVAGLCHAEAPPPYTDCCRMLECDIAGKWHGFLAGNHIYYVGGAADAEWRIVEHETLGFTHPMFRDGRARGHGIVTGPGGTGHDKWGWEFWRRTRGAYGRVIVDGKDHGCPRPSKMIWRPDRQVCVYEVGGVRIEETKFISTDDVLCAIITTSKPVSLAFDGHSFVHTGRLPGHDGDKPVVFSRDRTARASFDRAGNAIHLVEGGTIMTKPVWGTPAVEGKLMYDGLHVVLSASRDLGGSHTIRRDEEGRQVYTFTADCAPGEDLVLAWAMGDEHRPTLERVRKLLSGPREALAAKTKHMNDLLNRQVPYFRCSDEDVVKTYYYLWSLYFMYFTHTGKGWEQYPHTQTAVNNFMGLHLWDSWAYAAMGAWVVDKWAYSHGNVLSWKSMVPFKNRHNALPDNFGIAWYSPGVWMNLVGTVEFAWRQYEQSGDREFLLQVYDDLYRKLYWTGPQTSFGIEVNALDDLARMAETLGRQQDAAHWKAMRPGAVERFRAPWSQRWPDYYAGKGAKWKDIWHLASMMCREMPDDWARAMVRRWVMNSEAGFLGPVPLDVRPPDSPENGVFAVSSISTWLAVEGMFRHGCDTEAVHCTLGHLRGMVRDHGFPVAPECWDPNYKPWGSMYYNWDGCVLPLLIERLAGVRYSIPDGTFTVSGHLPESWRHVEVRVPVVVKGEAVWTTVRTRRAIQDGRTVKTTEVANCPLAVLIVRPWLEDRQLIATDPPASDPPSNGHVGFRLQNARNASVSVTLGGRNTRSTDRR